jgi:hypothetical protein
MILVALIYGDEVYIGSSSSIDYLYRLAEERVDMLKCETGLLVIDFYIQNGYQIIEQFSL